MSLQRRISKLEGSLISELSVLLFTTHYEGKDGSIDSTRHRAFLNWGNGHTNHTVQASRETAEDFNCRLKSMQKLSAVQAQVYIQNFERRDRQSDDVEQAK